VHSVKQTNAATSLLMAFPGALGLAI